MVLVLEGLVLGLILIVVCIVGIKDGAVGAVQLYEPAVQERCIQLGLTTRARIQKRAIAFMIVTLVLDLGYLLLFVYGFNGARGFRAGFWQLLVVLEVFNLVDRIIIDWLWVGKTNAWVIPGTEDMMPYISKKAACFKWVSDLLGYALAAALIAGIMSLILH